MPEPGEREGRGEQEGQEVSRIDTKEAGKPEFACGLIDPSRIAHMRVCQNESREKKKPWDGGNSRLHKIAGESRAAEKSRREVEEQNMCGKEKTQASQRWKRTAPGSLFSWNFRFDPRLAYR